MGYVQDMRSEGVDEGGRGRGVDGAAAGAAEEGRLCEAALVCADEGGRAPYVVVPGLLLHAGAVRGGCRQSALWRQPTFHASSPFGTPHA